MIEKEKGRKKEREEKLHLYIKEIAMLNHGTQHF
jgi:hypothetical protein